MVVVNLKAQHKTQAQKITTEAYIKKYPIDNCILKLSRIISLNSKTKFTLSRRVPQEVSSRQLLESGLQRSQLSYSALNPLMGRVINPVEDTLKSAPIVGYSRIGRGRSKAVIIKFDDETSGVWKPHKEVKMSDYRTEVLNYEFDQLFGFHAVPPTVERVIDGEIGSVQLFKRNISKFEENKQELSKMDFFDFINNHKDRLDDNFDFDAQGKVVLMDNAESFSYPSMLISKLYEFLIKKKIFKKKVERMRVFVKSPQGKEILEKMKLTDLKRLEREIAQYKGDKQAKRFIVRFKLAIEIANNIVSGKL